MLTERILSLQTTTGPMMATLPEAFARLCGGTLIGFDGLAAHQRHGWDFFLFQTAAMALARAGQATSAADDTAWQNLADADAWTGLLAALTPGCADTAWSLVVDDLRKPAFMQPPIPSASLARYAVAGTTPDEIDVLVTAKGHDVKPARAGAAEARHWLFALLILQTMQGYSGATNYGVARMNTGNGSRPLLMTTPSREMPTRFRRGVQAALAARASALDIHGGYYHGDGIPLLWLKPWETEDRLSLADLDPLFVEVCRRIRLVTDKNGNITAWGRGSEARRTNAEGAKGNLGDAWTPTPGGAALTVGGGGFDYRLMTKLLALRRPERPAAMEPPPAHKGDMWLQATVLVRGQGKTEGLHERWLPIGGCAWGIQRSGDGRQFGERYDRRCRRSTKGAAACPGRLSAGRSREARFQG